MTATENRQIALEHAVRLALPAPFGGLSAEQVTAAARIFAAFLDGEQS